MKFNRNPLSQAINVSLLASAAACMALASGAAMAQDGADDEDEGVELDRVVVTGSRIKRVDVEGALPVTVIDREQIELTGESNAADLLRSLSFNSTGSFRPQSGSSAQGTSTVSLRGLGASRTLVLINGRRMANAPSTGSSPDLNTIPLAAIERIEILTDGASAIYGTDALGGVINVITRRDFQGAELMYGQASVDPEGGDREEGHVIFGANSATTSIVAGASWNDRDIVFARDLPWYAPGASVYGNSFTDTDDFSSWASVPGGCGPEVGNNPEGFFLIGSATAIDGSGQRCAYNFALESADEASVKNASAFAYMTHEFSDNWSIFADVTATRTKSFGRYAPVPDTSDPIFGGLGPLSVDSPNNPTNPASPLFDPAFGAQRELNWWHRFDALGNRDNFVDTRLDDLLVGFEGYIFDAAEVEFGIRNTSNKVYDIGYNYLLRSAASDLIERGVYDLQRPTENDSDTLNAMSVTISRISRFDQDEIYGLVAWDMFETNSGPVQWVVGGEYLEQDYNDQYDSLSEAGVVGGSAGNSAGGQRDVTSFYFETLIPLGNFEISVAGRNDDYSDVGSNFSPKVSFRWQPMDTLTLRGSYGEGFRAPTLDVVTQLDSFSADSVNDPVSCVAQGQPETCQLQINGLRTANPDLAPEESDQWSLGVAWEPTDWFFGKLDYYNIEITNRINFFSAQELINLELAGDPVPPGLGVVRLPNGVIQTVVQGFGNEGSVNNSGIDLNLQTNFEIFGGLLSNNLQVSYIDEFTIDGGRNTVEDPGVPQYRANLWNNFSIGSFGFAWNINVIGDQFDNIAANPAGGVIKTGHVPTWVTHDLQANWFTPWDGQLVIGCQNCGAKDPPIDVGFIDQRDYDFRLYNGFGRIVYARYKQTF